MSNAVPSALSVIATLMVVTWRRILRGRALWVAFAITLMPALIAIPAGGEPDALEPIAAVAMFVMALLPPVFIAGSIGEEIEDRTTTYLWSRPIPRWTMLVGKLLALAPVAMVLVVLAWILGAQVGTQQMPPPLSILGYAAGAATISAMSVGIGTLVPKHGMALAIVYIVIIDSVLSAVPASVATISIMRQVRLISGFDHFDHPPPIPEPPVAEPLIAMAVIAAVWLAVGFWRVRRLES